MCLTYVSTKARSVVWRCSNDFCVFRKCSKIEKMYFVEKDTKLAFVKLMLDVPSVFARKDYSYNH